MRTVCIVSPVYDEEEVLPSFISEIEKIRSDCGATLSLLLVDDGSKDRTWELIEQAAGRHSWIAGVQLSRNFGHQAALSCGYRIAHGEAVISMDADLQDPPELISKMITIWLSGADIVYGVRNCRKADSIMKRTTAGLFYRLMDKIGGFKAPQNAGDYRLISRKALDALNSMEEGYLYLRGMVGWIGYTTATVEYRRPARPAGETKFSFLKMMRFASDSIASFSTAPLKLSYALSACLLLILLIYAIYCIVSLVFYGGRLESGWLSLMASITLIGIANFLCLGVIGEYVGRIYIETKKRPTYLVNKKVNIS